MLLLLPTLNMFSQCPEVFDFFGNTVDNPYWYDCSGGNYTLNLQSPDDWGEYTIDWGDGSPVETGASWTSPTPIPHVYTAVVDTFIVTISEVNTGCSLEGVVVMEEATSASIQIPIGGLTQACAPQEMEFINSSTNVSETTVFTWDFGDGSPPLTFDYTNWNEVISHVYQQNTVDCETEVSLSAENYCNTIQGGASEATFNPIRIWDLDEAAITASATVLCYPDTTVTFTNTTERNCLFQGNIYQRYEYWNFGDYWGEGTDSIIDWTPWPPTFPNTVAYPGIGTYEVQLLDSNFCGIDTANLTITIVPPPVADIVASEDTICVGEPITFFQQATGGADQYQWNFDDGIGWLPTGGGNITYVFNTPGTYNVCSAVGIQSANGGCADTACVEVVVLPSPTANIGFDNLNGCDALTVNFEDLSVGSTNSTWTFDVAPFTFNGANPPPVDYNSPGTYVVNLLVEGLNGCLDNDQELVNVYQSPQADFLADNVCEGTEAEFTDLTIPDPGDPITGWQWDFGDAGTAFDQNPTHVYANTGSYDVTLNVNTANCSSSVTYPIEVEPAPIPNVTADPTEGCSPLEVTFTNNTTGAASFQWNFGDNNGSNDQSPTHVFQNLTQTDTTYTVVMSAFSTFGCASTDTLYITVYPGAQASFTDNSNPPGCAPFDAVFINTSVGADNYFWDLGDGFTTTDESPTHTYVNETGFVETFDVTLIAYANNGCHDTTMTSVIVYPTANFDFELTPDSACSPLVVTMPFIQGVNEYDWNFGDGTGSTFPTPTHIWENFSTDPAEYTVTLIGTSAFGCVDTASTDVFINPQPLAQFATDINAGCSPLTIQLENMSIQADSYQWVYEPGDTSYTDALAHSHTFVNLTTETITYQVELTAISDDGCTHTFVVPVDVYPEVQASFEDPGDGCHPYAVDFNNTTINGDDFQWDFGNGLIALTEDASSIFQNPSAIDSTYTVQLYATSDDGCSNLFALNLVVHPQPTASFDMSWDEGCHPSPAILTNNSTLATEFLWDYGDGFQSDTVAVEHAHTFSSTSGDPVTYTVSLTAITEFGCTNVDTAPYTVFPDVTAAATSIASGCSPLEVTFSNQSLGASQGFEWEFGDGGMSNQNNPTHVFINETGQDTIYNVQLVAESIYGCTDTTYIPIEVFNTPIAIAELDTTIGCYPVDAVFINNSTGADSYQWVYGTGEVSDTAAVEHTHTYYNLGSSPVIYNITLNAFTASGCQASDDLSIEILPLLQADGGGNLQGCSPLTVEFENYSQGALSYEWQFGDGDFTNVAEPTHTYENETTEDVVFEVMLVANSFFGCADTTFMDVVVFATPMADFNAQPEVQAFPNSIVQLGNESVAGDVATYSWDMGNDVILEGEDPGPYDYGTWGTFTIELLVSNGFCADTAMRTIEITPPPPEAGFLGPAEGCAPLTVNFQDLSDYVVGWQWDFGDGGEANVSDPVYTYYQPGIYTVTLTVEGILDGTSDVAVQEALINVYPTAVAAFTVTPQEVSVPGDPVYTINLSENASTYFWDFGDGATSVDTNPIHYYQEEGIYTISLTANNQYNCPSTYVFEDAVYAESDAFIDFPNAFTPNLAEASDGFYNPANFDNDIFFPMQTGVIEYQLQIFNKWGEMLFESTDVAMGWNGYYKGEICKQDVYAWKVKARFSNGEEIIKAGDVTLLIK
ncbi:PKD domain-containing protein [Sanyastnella coralliicola]|uniref:PKD domain-containing protein n=1 Tax=Sanyastnella coralliicola TaxID=3069118 RepID=UPI0027B8BA42|nr:PKD domain-containing protein [Longitalea sp. SCSIO 12813]